jgi:C4-dicarboxylate-specific signal transduction histidine kinase
MEALTDRPNPRINITAGRSYSPERPPGVEVTVSDNAGGIAESLRDKVLSPFCTSKKGGMGLGLPIAQRTVSDHEGQLHIATGEMGTTVTISLPTGRGEEETGDEAPADRG